MAQDTEDSSNATPVPQMSPEDMRGLATRLRARAASVLLWHQPEQHRDLVTAAGLIEHLAELTTEILSSAEEIDRLARLLGIMGGR